MTRRYLRKLARRLHVVVTPKAPVPVRPVVPAVVDPVAVVVGLGLGLAGLLIALAGWS